MSPAESTGFTPPAAFGPYRVLHQIGSGVLGPVFRTYDPQNDRLVAVKAFRLEIVPEDVARLAESLRRLPAAGLSHAGIVNAIDAGLEGMSAFLAMEYVSAETLDVALRHLAPSPLDRALPLITDIAEAIEAAWASGYGHGSLHPRDVFVASGTNEVRVTGFGVGQALEAAGIKVPPRRPYTAPERSAGGAWDIRADLYSLGAIAHELLTKRRPGGAGEQDGSLVTGTTPEQRRLIRGVLGAALADSPEHRFHSARAFASALGAIVRGEPVGPLPEGPAPAEPMPEPVREAPIEVVPEEPKKPARGRSQVAKPAPLFASIDTAPAEPPAPPAVVPPPVAEPEPPVVEPPPPVAERHVPAAASPEATLVLAKPPVEVHASAHADVPAAPKVAAADPAASPRHAPVPEPAVHPVHHVEIQHVTPLSPHVGSVFAPEPEPAAPTMSWRAIAAIVIATAALAGTGGYWAGQHGVGKSAAPATASTTSAASSASPAQTPPAIPPGTDVAVPTDPVSPPSAAAGSTPKPADPKQTASAADTSRPAPASVAPAASGRLLVRSTPPESAVRVDGRARGTTPATIRDLSLGTHTVEVSHAGFVTRTERVTLSATTASRTLDLDLKAQPASAPPPATAGRSATGAGSIFLDSRPSGARVFLDGKDSGRTPATLPDIKVGSHKLRFELTGYKTLDTSVTVRSGQQERVTVTLEQTLISLVALLCPFPLY